MHKGFCSRSHKTKHSSNSHKNQLEFLQVTSWHRLSIVQYCTVRTYVRLPFLEPRIFHPTYVYCTYHGTYRTGTAAVIYPSSSHNISSDIFLPQKVLFVIPCPTVLRTIRTYHLRTIIVIFKKVAKMKINNNLSIVRVLSLLVRTRTGTVYLSYIPYGST